jgi:uncharacterized SAM-binding protein YcdF (DUF218 family)
VNQILKAQKIEGSYLLVTSARHMPRSMAIFRKLGLSVIAAPTDFQVTHVDENAGFLGFVLELLPGVDGLEQTTNALKEWIGFVTYRLRGWT